MRYWLFYYSLLFLLFIIIIVIINILKQFPCVTLELARGTNIPSKNIPNSGPPQIPKMLYAN